MAGQLGSGGSGDFRRRWEPTGPQGGRRRGAGTGGSDEAIAGCWRSHWSGRQTAGGGVGRVIHEGATGRPAGEAGGGGRSWRAAWVGSRGRWGPEAKDGGARGLTDLQ
ncbi:uncharacterized protein LOC131874229 [Cryptomeria japonica]|uniref:uncharacterized protein LOC131874229 n=1 Tax=Cryptomeria japonica TaxID=3369 RepID=UPI0027DA14B9|nr:uncharacterized protein LOC131874229 [Cryptomeria japonica]